MPIKDPEKRKEAQRESMRLSRVHNPEGSQETGSQIPGSHQGSQRLAEPGEMGEGWFTRAKINEEGVLDPFGIPYIVHKSHPSIRDIYCQEGGHGLNIGTQDCPVCQSVGSALSKKLQATGKL